MGGNFRPFLLFFKVMLLYQVQLPLLGRQRRKCHNEYILLDQSHTCRLSVLLPSLDTPQRKFHMLHIYSDQFYKPYFIFLIFSYSTKTKHIETLL